MYNDELRKNVITDLDNKKINLVNTAVVLASQGYVINKIKYIKLDWISIMIDAFENINMFNEAQQHNIELLYNKLARL